MLVWRCNEDRDEDVRMASPSRSEYKQLWDDAGWCVIEGVIPPDDLADAQRALPDLFPTADEFADNVDPERNAPFFTERGAPRVQFPFESGALNRVALHDAMLDIAECLLETRDIRVYQAAVIAKYSDAAPDYEQLLHVDYANHTLVVPRTDVGYQHLTTFVYLTDVTPSTGATRIVSREHSQASPRATHPSTRPPGRPRSSPERLAQDSATRLRLASVSLMPSRAIWAIPSMRALTSRFGSPSLTKFG